MPDLKYNKFRPTGMPAKFGQSGGSYQGEEPSSVELLLSHFIREVDRNDDNFRKFWSIYERSYKRRKAIASELDKLLWYDECPDRYIFRIAENLGFPLLDAPYAGESERRNFLKYAAWIFRRKGTLTALNKIFTILGFWPLLEEEVQENFILNFHKLYGLEQRTSELLMDDFNDGNADGWSKQNTSSDWEVLSNKFVGTGSGTDSRDNCVITANSYERFYFQTDFQILGGSGSKFPYFGIYLSYNGAYSSSFGIFFYSEAGHDYLKLSGVWSGFNAVDQAYDITGKIDYKSGLHTLKVQYYREKISVGIDDIALITPYEIPGGLAIYWPFYYKGLFVNESTQVAFDNVEIRRLKSMGVPVLPGGNSQRILKIWLSGSPANAAAKKEYLQDVVPRHFVPTGVQVNWEE